ncbi:OLC1v1012675C1 [Oldenlandia corymbosa var. corymbosa]|uniref:OLC1v1012675C1 n=1 Tax=Oldenlandia corymbosa var. corymbosa TaxID=529605 RepID=A0AAV1DZH1_OLDCO|nr:OLC1v1012675C1 [Oldenlandia corymbosa var. corymbosa]
MGMNIRVPKFIKFRDVSINEDVWKAICNKVKLSVYQNFVLRVLSFTCDIICFKLNNRIKLLNPITRQVREIIAPFARSKYRGVWSIVFDYISKVQRYYMICLQEWGEGDMVAMTLSWQAGRSYAEDYSLGNCGWRRLDVVCPRNVIPEGFFVGKLVYWPICAFGKYAKLEHSRSDLLVSFNTDSETFEFISSPDDPHWNNCDESPKINMKILNLQGTLCLTDENLVFVSRKFHLWAFKLCEHGGDIWSKLYENTKHCSGPIEHFEKLSIELFIDIMLRFDCKTVGQARRVRQSWRTLLDEHQVVMHHRLPHDLVNDILKRLDVRTMGKCRCVHRAWRRLMISEEFVTSIRVRNEIYKRASDIVLVHRPITATANEPDSISILYFNSDIPIDLQLCPSLGVYVHSIRVQNILPYTCDLMCFILDRETGILNPTTGLFGMLPAPFDETLFGCCWFATFGYNAGMCQYTLVILMISRTGETSCEIFSWEAGQTPRLSLWTDSIAACPKRCWNKGVCCGNYMFCQLFKIINYPSDEFWAMYPLCGTINPVLLNYKGSLCLSDEDDIERSGLFVMWKLGIRDAESDLDVKYEWNKIYSVRVEFNVVRSHRPYPRRHDTFYLRRLILNCYSSDDGKFILAGPLQNQYYNYKPDSNSYVLHTKPHDLLGKYELAIRFHCHSLSPV